MSFLNCFQDIAIERKRELKIERGGKREKDGNVKVDHFRGSVGSFAPEQRHP